MNIEDTIRVLYHERACVMRQTGPGCDRKCEACDLVLPDKTVLSAYQIAINVLLAINIIGAQQETEKSHARDGFIRCGYVQVAETFGERLKPYEGCPRGSEGLKGYPSGQEPGRIAAVIGYLVDARDNVLIGPDEDYVCVPKMWYDRCLTDLQEELKGDATE